MAMLRRSLLIAAAASIAGPARAAGLPYGPSHSFAAYRSGQRIGSHALAFAEAGNRLTVTTSIDFSVRTLGIVVYRYRHLCNETWSDGAFAGLSSQTDDDGAKNVVEARSSGSGLAVRRRSARALVKTGGPDEASQPTGWTSESLPADLLPSTHWNVEQVRRSALLNSQSGALANVVVAPGPQEAVKTANGSLQATRYAYSGDIRMTQWFDDRGRWVKSAFQVFDGSTIEYILQE